MIVSCDWEIYYIPRPSRYYLDFCVKYHYESSSKESLPHFIQKLRHKNRIISNRGRLQMQYHYFMR